MVFALAGDSTITSVFFILVLDFAFAFVFVLVFVAAAAKPSLPLSTPIRMQFIFYDKPLHLHLQEHEGQI